MDPSTASSTAVAASGVAVLGAAALSSTSTATPSAKHKTSKRWKKQLSPTTYRVETGKEEAAMAHIASRSYNAGKIFFGVTVKGDVEKFDFERAAKLVQVKHPILRCRFRRAGWTGSWELVEDMNLSIPIIRVNETMSWEELYEKYAQPVEYKPFESPQLIIYVLTQPSPATTSFQVFVEIQHWCSDGTSVSFLLHDILRWASGEADSTEEGTWPLPMNLALRDPSKSPPWSTWRTTKSLGYLLSVLSTPYTRFPLLKSPSASKHRTMGFCESFSKEDSARLLQQCRNHGTTLTCASGIAFTYGIAKALKRKQGRFMIFVATNTRDLCQATDHDLSIHVTMTPMLTSYTDWTDSDKSAWPQSKDLKARLNQVTSSHLQGFSLLTPLGMHLKESQQPTPTFLLTSWGARSPLQDSYNSTSIEEAHLRTATHHFLYPALSVFSVCGRVYLSWTGGEDKHDKVLFQEAFKEGVRVLKNMLTPTTSE